MRRPWRYRKAFAQVEVEVGEECVSLPELMVTIATPVPGVVVLHGNATIGSTGTEYASVVVGIDESPTECVYNPGYDALVTIPYGGVVSVPWYATVPVFDVVDVEAGTHSFRVNGRRFSSGGFVYVSSAAIEAVFYPRKRGFGSG